MHVSCKVSMPSMDFHGICSCIPWNTLYGTGMPSMDFHAMDSMHSKEPMAWKQHGNGVWIHAIQITSEKYQLENYQRKITARKLPAGELPENYLRKIPAPKYQLIFYWLLFYQLSWHFIVHCFIVCIRGGQMWFSCCRCIVMFIVCSRGGGPNVYLVTVVKCDCLVSGDKLSNWTTSGALYEKHPMARAHRIPCGWFRWCYTERFPDPFFPP